MDFAAVDDLGAVWVDVDHGFFEIDVFAGVHGINGGLFVPVIGRGDDDGVDIFAGEDLAVVAGGEEVDIVGRACSPEFFGVSEASVVAVGDGDEFHAGNAEGGGGVALALDACSDESELDVVVGGGRLCSGSGESCECVDLRGCSGACELNEGPAIQSGHWRDSLS